MVNSIELSKKAVVMQRQFSHFKGHGRWVGAIASLLICTTPTRLSATEIFDNRGIEFEQNTIIEFEMVQFNPAKSHQFGVLNLKTGKKTPLLSNQSGGRITEFKFMAYTPYAFYLEFQNATGAVETVFSNNAQNIGQTQRAQFQGGLSALSNTIGVSLGWATTDGTTQPRFNEFLVQIGGFVGCPCKIQPLSR